MSRIYSLAQFLAFHIHLEILENVEFSNVTIVIRSTIIYVSKGLVIFENPGP